MNYVLFLSRMAIDTLLTSAIARERVGNLVELPEGYVPLFRVYVPVPGSQCRKYEDFEDTSFRFSVEGTTFDCSWEFDENSSLVRSVGRLRESQAALGFLDPETITEHERVSNTFSSAFLHMVTLSYHEALEQRGLDFLYKINDGSIMTGGTTHATFSEALMNAIEHGSVYAQRGPVNVRFLGGDKGFAFLVDNPRDDFVLRLYTVEDLTALYTRKYGAIPQEPTTVEAFQRFEEGIGQKVVDEVRHAEYNRLALQAFQMRQAGVPYTRGNGMLMMFGNKATVGFEKTKKTNRIIVGYFVK